jgi:hypothetical protein
MSASSNSLGDTQQQEICRRYADFLTLNESQMLGRHTLITGIDESDAICCDR